MATLKFKSKLVGFRKLSTRNKAFDRLSNADKRKEIAWDALQLLVSGNIEAERGIYWSNALKAVKAINSEKFQEKIVELSEAGEPERCKVCARGALMLSQVRLGNTIGSRDSNRANGSDVNLRGFDMNDFCNMEGNFERGRYGTDKYCRSDKANENLANILINVIKNGNYNIDDETDYVTKYRIEFQQNS